jgi:transcription elongation factor S-II
MLLYSIQHFVSLIYSFYSICIDSFTATAQVLSRATDIEKTCYQEFRGVSADYRNKMRRLILNLKDKNNPDLRRDILSGRLEVSRFCTMSVAVSCVTHCS